MPALVSYPNQAWSLQETWGGSNLAKSLPLFLLALWSGSLAGRLDRRQPALVAQASMVPGTLGLGLCLRPGFSSMAAVIPLTAALGFAFVFKLPARRAIIPGLVPPEAVLNGIAPRPPIPTWRGA